MNNFLESLPPRSGGENHSKAHEDGSGHNEVHNMFYHRPAPRAKQNHHACYLRWQDSLNQLAHPVDSDMPG